MPSLFRFIAVLSFICALGYAGLYVLAVHFEPEQHEVRDQLPSIKIRKE